MAPASVLLAKEPTAEFDTIAAFLYGEQSVAKALLVFQAFQFFTIDYTLAGMCSLEDRYIICERIIQILRIFFKNRPYTVDMLLSTMMELFPEGLPDAGKRKPDDVISSFFLSALEKGGVERKARIPLFENIFDVFIVKEFSFMIDFVADQYNQYQTAIGSARPK